MPDRFSRYQMILIVKRKQATSVSLPSESRSQNFHLRSYFPGSEKILPIVYSLQNKIRHLWIPHSLYYYIALAPTCWIHLLDENGEVEPALSCLKIKQAQSSSFFSNFTVFPYKSLKMHQSQVGVKKYLRRWTTSSTKIQVWTTFCLHPNLCKSISKLDHNLVFQSLSAQHTIHVHNVY